MTDQPQKSIFPHMAGEIDNRRIEEEVKEAVTEASVELEMVERLRELHELEIGRAFVHRSKDARSVIYLAYSLPLDRMLSRHIVVFNDGTLMLTEAADEGYQARYSHELGPNPNAMSLVSDEITLTHRYFLHGVSEIKSKGIKSSMVQDDAPELIELLKKGLALGKELKQEREKAQSVQDVVGVLGNFIELQSAPDADERKEFDR